MNQMTVCCNVTSVRSGKVCSYVLTLDNRTSKWCNFAAFIKVDRETFTFRETDRR